MTQLSNAEKSFLAAMGASVEKLASLQPRTMEALGIEDPNAVDAIEEQAAQAVGQPAVDEGVPQEAPLEEPQPAVEESPPEIEINIPSGFFSNKDTHPIHLATLLKSLYDDDWVEWLPETLWETIRKDLSPVSDVNKNKIQAIAVSLSTDAPWQDWNIFENCGKAFSGTIPHFGAITPLTPVEAVFTLEILRRFHPDFNLSGEVKGYIASCCLYYGLSFLPKEWFGDIQEVLDKQNQNKEANKEIAVAWKKLQGVDVDSIEFSDSKVVDVQMRHLLEIKNHLLVKEEQLKEI